jgi:choline dehydrogenase-like flavoprotein
MERTPPPRHVEVLIVGSGPAGSTYARTIGDAAPGASILVVEVGPSLGSTVGEHTMNLTAEERIACQLLTQGPDAGMSRSTPALASLVAEGDAGPGGPFVFPGLFLLGEGSRVDDEFGLPAASMSSGVGGMGVHWGGSCPRPGPTERVPFIEDAELDALYNHAEGLLGVSKDLDGGDPLLAALRDVVAAEFDDEVPGARPTGFMPVAARRHGTSFRSSGTGMILGDLAARVPGFVIRPETLARRIVVEAGAAVGAELVDRVTGEQHLVRADRVVVCADSLRTPQLLFASGIRPRALGHHLNDHFQMSAFAKLRPEYVLPAPTDDGPLPMGSVLVPFAGPERPVQGQVVPLSRIGGRWLFGDTLAGLPVDEFAVLAWYGAKDIQFGDAVEFSDAETDFYGMPRMRIRYRLTDRDRRTIDVLRTSAARAATAVGDLVAEPSFAPGGSSLHYQGTVRMGRSDDGDSVCDSQSRVWGVEHLYVGGNGVIPTATAANPTLTNVALATRAARHLVATL